MKFAMFAMLASAVVAEECSLSSTEGDLEVSCSIPITSDFTSECCSATQNINDKMAMHEMPTPQEKMATMQACQRFQMSLVKHGDNPVSVIQNLPEGMTCTETILGGGATACELKARLFDRLSVTCEIPEETTITSGCCNAIQDGIDNYEHHEPPTREWIESAKQECASLHTYVMQHMPHGPPPRSEQEASMKIISSLPSGLSCTETISGDEELSLYANRTLFSAIALASGVGTEEFSHEKGSISPLVSGVAGFFAGGMFVAGALFRYSKRRHGNQEPLLEPEVA